MTTFKPWTPPPGVAVVQPPCHVETEVDLFFSDRSELLKVRAGSQNWSAVGDGPDIVAYAIVEEYKPAPREWWLIGDIAFPSAAVAHNVACGKPPDWEVIHVREVPDPSREVVAWAVVRKDGTHAIYTDDNVKSARWYASEYGGTVVRLTGVLPRPHIPKGE